MSAKPRTIPRTAGAGLRARLEKKVLASQEGKIGYILLWLLGVPIPVLLLIFGLRGCN